MRSIGKIKSKVIREFLQGFPNEKTQTSYGSALLKYFEVIGAEPDNYLIDIRELSNGEKNKIMDRYEDDITKYWSYLNKKYAPKSANNYTNVIKIFFRDNRIYFNEGLWQRLRKRGKGNYAVTQDRAPEPYELRKIMTHTDAKGKALFLTLVSSGMRIGEALELEPDDIDFNYNPTKINIRAETSKNKQARTTFISEEATEALQEWLKLKDEYIKKAMTRIVGLQKSYKGTRNITKNPDDKRIFPFCYTTAKYRWTLMLKKAGLDMRDKRTKVLILHIHTLRKYFRTYFGNVDVAEVLMGHSGYLTTYRIPPVSKLAEDYLKAEQNLSVYKTPVNSSRYELQVAELKDENEQLKRRMDDITFGNSISDIAETGDSGRKDMVVYLQKQIDELKQILNKEPTEQTTEQKKHKTLGVNKNKIKDLAKEEKHQQYLARKRMNAKAYRQRMTPEQKEKKRTRDRKAQQRYYEKQKNGVAVL